MKESKIGESMTHIPNVASEEERQMMIERFGEGIYEGNPVEIIVHTYAQGRKKNKLITQIIRKMNYSSEEAIKRQHEVLSEIASKRIEKKEKELDNEMEDTIPELFMTQYAIEELNDKKEFYEFDEFMLLKLRPKLEKYREQLADKMAELESELRYILSREGFLAEVEKIGAAENFNSKNTEVNQVMRSLVEKILYDREADVYVLSIFFK